MRPAATFAVSLPLLLAVAAPAAAHHRQRRSVGYRLIEVGVDVGGRPTPLYPAPDRSGRYYLEALEGRSYAVRLRNRTGQRLGVELRIDGLNAISGEPSRGHERGRLYVLEPWSSATIRGWRSSLDDVQRFEFVDEQSSYAARSGITTSRMGWIELRAFRERPRPRRIPTPLPVTPGVEEGRSRPQPEARSEEPAETADAAGESSGAKRSYPGTGWGRKLDDRARVVDFEAESHPAETVTLRYEYAAALHALGVWPQGTASDRLRERERGVAGFAPPPPRR